MKSRIYQLANDFSMLTNRCIFLTGKAGTGKTTFLHELRQATDKQMAIAAPTGIAAIHAGGVTLHSLFQLPFAPFIPTEEGRRDLIANNKMRSDRRRILAELELLVIDEVSMLRADTLDAIDTLLRHFRHRKHLPFGGIQVILIGDLFQLSPVIRDDERMLLHPHYRGPYFFQSHVWQSISPVYIELDKIFRQQNADFVEILNQVRNNCLTPQNLSRLNGLYDPTFVSSDDNFHITLTTHNRIADGINAKELAKLKLELRLFKAKVDGDFSEKNYPTEASLELKVGARVMFVKNDDQTPRRFFNGQIGRVESMTRDTVRVESEGEIIDVLPMAWRNVRYTVNQHTKVIDEEQIGSFVQHPLRLAWAVTIHKSQGLTFDRVVIDAENAFAAGQVYVALSRCRTLDGIVLLSRISTSSLQNAREVIAHESTKLPLEQLETDFRASQRTCQIQLFASIFEFRALIQQSENLLALVKRESAKLNEPSYAYVESLLTELRALDDVGARFARQLGQILSSADQPDDIFLRERFAAAHTYFTERIETLCTTLREAPIRTDVKALAGEIQEVLVAIYGVLQQKMVLMAAMKNEPTQLNYYTTKQNFRYTPLMLRLHAAATAEVQATSDHPQLLRSLTLWRNQRCKTDNLPVYLVGGTAMMVDISNRMPQNKTELIAIKGFGPGKYAKYGEDILNIIRQYTSEKGITPPEFIFDQPAKKTKKTKAATSDAPKREKGETFRTTLSLYLQGKTLEQIATSRSLTQSTIASHLCRFIETGEVNIDDLITPHKRTNAQTIMDSDLEPEDKSAQLRTFLTTTERTVFYAWRRILMGN